MDRTGRYKAVVGSGSALLWEGTSMYVAVTANQNRRLCKKTCCYRVVISVVNIFFLSLAVKFMGEVLITVSC